MWRCGWCVLRHDTLQRPPTPYLPSLSAQLQGPAVKSGHPWQKTGEVFTQEPKQPQRTHLQTSQERLTGVPWSHPLLLTQWRIFCLDVLKSHVRVSSAAECSYVVTSNMDRFCGEYLRPWSWGKHPVNGRPGSTWSSSPRSCPVIQGPLTHEMSSERRTQLPPCLNHCHFGPWLSSQTCTLTNAAEDSWEAPSKRATRDPTDLPGIQSLPTPRVTQESSTLFEWSVNNSHCLTVWTMYIWNLSLDTFIWFWFFGQTHVACRILVPWPGTEPGPLAAKVRSPNHWTTREFPWNSNLYSNCEICCCQ